MRGAGRLAGRGAGGHDVLAVFAVIDVPDFLCRDNDFGYLLVVGSDGQIIRGTQLLAEPERVAGTYLDALSTGDALRLVDLGHEVRTNRVPRAEHKADAQTEAGAGAAVADSGAVAGPFDVGNIMHKAVILGALDYLESLLLGDLPCASAADVVLRALTHLDAHILVQMSAAVAYRGA